MLQKFRMAIPNKGRLRDPAVKLLEQMGIQTHIDERTYISKTNDPDLELLLLRAFDIPLYVQYGAADLGVTGRDVIVERDAKVYELKKLDFGECQLVVATPAASRISSLDDLPPDIKIATEYPNTTARFFESRGVHPEILSLRGATEIAPSLGLADMIVDLSSSGATLHRNGLRVVGKILDSTAEMIANSVSFRVNRARIDDLLDKLNGKASGTRRIEGRE